MHAKADLFSKKPKTIYTLWCFPNSFGRRPLRYFGGYSSVPVRKKTSFSNKPVSKTSVNYTFQWMFRGRLGSPKWFIQDDFRGPFSSSKSAPANRKKDFQPADHRRIRELERFLYQAAELKFLKHILVDDRKNLFNYITIRLFSIRVIVIVH